MTYVISFPWHVNAAGVTKGQVRLHCCFRMVDLLVLGLSGVTIGNSARFRFCFWLLEPERLKILYVFDLASDCWNQFIFLKKTLRQKGEVRIVQQQIWYEVIHSKKYTQKYQARKKTVKLYRPWWSTVIVCEFHQAHITPNGVGQTEAKTDYKKV